MLVERERLLEGSRLAEALLPARTPARAHLLLEARGATCTLHAAGPDVALRLTLPADVEQPGAALLPARQALAILRRTDAEVLLVESAAAGRLRLEGEGAEFDLKTPDPGRLPDPTPLPPGAGHPIPAACLCRGLRRTLLAVGRPTRRYALHAVLCEVEADRVRLVTTDNRRLAVAEVPLAASAEPLAPAQHLLPASAPQLLARVAAGQDEPVRAAFGQRHALFQAGGALLRARYVEGHLPPWQKLLTDRTRYFVPVPVGPFFSAVRQAAAVREPQGGRLAVRFAPGRVLLESCRPGQGRARVGGRLPSSGAAVEVALKAGDRTELPAALEPETTLLFGVTGPEAPVLAVAGDE
jgi:DNA polymerase-3 subunit beta